MVEENFFPDTFHRRLYWVDGPPNVAGLESGILCYIYYGTGCGDQRKYPGH